ncbi:MAG: LTA synthase family protein [Desulfovibrio sp.]|jgi:phosphoglycerol transferase MdoB-like AlkP superfamily enzyme|nr:LTA synthase family protein [Desulfovibrio sp.]
MADVLLLILCMAVSGIIAVAAQRFAILAGQCAPSLAGDCMALLAGIQTSSLFLLLTGRILLSLLLVAALLCLLVVFNRAKEEVLREPLVLADAWLLPQVFLYPEMYFPFLPMRGITAGLALLVLILAGLVFLEKPLPLLRSFPGIASCAAVTLLPVAALWRLRQGFFQTAARFLLRLLPVSHDAVKDAARNGALASALTHPVLAGHMKREKPEWMREERTRPKASHLPEALENLLRETAAMPMEKRPHIALIQAESFCDFRERMQGPQKESLKDFLPNWDKLKAAGRSLPTPENAYGAYTMRTEFAMLTGLRQEDLGPWAFNPYLLAARQPLWSVARYFAEKGYATVCIHPYYKKFFQRDKVMSNLSFEKFLGIEELADLEHFGPYVSDAALGKRMVREMETSSRPVFCFAITMEAHGPWRTGRLTADELAAELPDINLGLFTQEEQYYLCHLRHMDRLFGMLAAPDAALQRGYKLLAYGDHAPGLGRTSACG